MKKILFCALVIVCLILMLTPVLARAEVPRPTCYPLVNGYPAGLPEMHSGSAGDHLFWFCSDSKGSKPFAQGFSWLRPQYNPAAAAEVLRAVTRASARVGTANAAWDQHMGYHCADVVAENTARGRLCKERQAFYEANKARWGVQ